MLEFVETLTLAPWEASERDWTKLHDLGMHELEIAQVVLGCAHFNYLNRMADGLGIPAEYGGNLGLYEPGRGQERREEMAAAVPRAESNAVAANFERLPVDASVVQSYVSANDPPPRDLVAVLSFNADLARGVLAWRTFQLRGTDLLPSKLRATIALFAAGVENTSGAARHARSRALALGVPIEELERFEEGEIPAAASARDRLVFEHVRRLLQSPAKTQRAHIDELRSHGFDDREVVRLTMLVSYLSFEHRLWSGLLAG